MSIIIKSQVLDLEDLLDFNDSPIMKLLVEAGFKVGQKIKLTISHEPGEFGRVGFVVSHLEH